MELRKLKDKASEAFVKGRFSKAAELYEEYLQAEPKDQQARLRMGDAWAKAGQRDKAIHAYHLAAESFAREGFLPRAIAASKLILELDPTHQGVQQMLADLYARRGTPSAGVRAVPRAPTPVPAPAPVPAAAEKAAPVPAAPVLAQRVPAAREEAPAASPPPPPAARSEPLPAPAPAVQPPRPPEPPRAATGPLPPGLSPRSTPRPPLTPAPTSVTPGGAPTPTAPIPAGLVRRVPWVASSPLLSSSAETSPEETPSAPAAPPAPQTPMASPGGGGPPGLRPRRVGESESPPPPAQPALRISSFTELELEADSLLHAVEMAALAGMRQRASDLELEVGTAEPQEDEETVFSLTEDFVDEAPSLDALPNIPLFSDLPRDAFIELFERCPLRRFGPGERIIAQGTQGDAFYVICEGQVRVFREDEGGPPRQLAVLEAGAFFGEMALLSETPRMASVESTAEDTQLLEISAPVLAELSGRYPQVARALKRFCRERLLRDVMSNSALFQLLGRKDRRELVERFRARDVRRNDVIIRDGEQTDGLYVVLAGELEVYKNEQLLNRLKEGDIFGEISLLQKTPATATVTATRRTTLLRLPREDFDPLITRYPQVLALVSELTDERLRRTEQVLGASEDDLILF